MNIAVFAGSFDPFTIGHKDIVERALPLFDKIIIAIGQNSEKTPLFDIATRTELINKTFANNPKVAVETYSGLTIDFCRAKNANFLLRGVRNTIDFEYEKQIAEFNKQMSGIETILMFCSPMYEHISSTLCRDLYKHHYPISQYIC